jgi:hypothetical protein
MKDEHMGNEKVVVEAINLSNSLFSDGRKGRRTRLGDREGGRGSFPYILALSGHFLHHHTSFFPLLI